MTALRTTIAILLAFEAVNAALWSARIVSAAAAYDAVVLGMVLLRVLVSALQGVSAWLLAGRALPGLVFARWAFALSAVLMVFELGFRLSPSSVLPGLRIPLIAAYGLYAGMCIGALRYLDRAERLH